MNTSQKDNKNMELRYAQPQSFADASFFQQLSRLKLDEFKLDESKRPISAAVSIASIPQGENPAVSLSADSFSNDATV